MSHNGAGLGVSVMPSRRRDCQPTAPAIAATRTSTYDTTDGTSQALGYAVSDTADAAKYFSECSA